MQGMKPPRRTAPRNKSTAAHSSRLTTFKRLGRTFGPLHDFHDCRQAAALNNYSLKVPVASAGRSWVGGLPRLRFATSSSSRGPRSHWHGPSPFVSRALPAPSRRGFHPTSTKIWSGSSHSFNGPESESPVGVGTD